MTIVSYLQNAGKFMKESREGKCPISNSPSRAVSLVPVAMEISHINVLNLELSSQQQETVTVQITQQVMTTSSHNLRNPNLKKNASRPRRRNLVERSLTKFPSQISNTLSAGLPFSIDNENIWFVSQLACPVVLRSKIKGEDVRLCRCSSHSIPHVTDLEFDFLINNQLSSPEQITVICVHDSSKGEENDLQEVEELYGRKNRTRNMPCIQSRLDAFRLLKYNISNADEFTDRAGSLLVYRHNVAPGMFLMYIQGKLLFANYMFNGYSTSAKDLQKQLVKTKNDYHMGYYLPNDFRVRNQNPKRTMSGNWPRYTSQFGVTGTGVVKVALPSKSSL